MSKAPSDPTMSSKGARARSHDNNATTNACIPLVAAFFCVAVSCIQVRRG